MKKLLLFLMMPLVEQAFACQINQVRDEKTVVVDCSTTDEPRAFLEQNLEPGQAFYILRKGQRIGSLTITERLDATTAVAQVDRFSPDRLKRPVYPHPMAKDRLQPMHVEIKKKRLVLAPYVLPFQEVFTSSLSLEEDRGQTFSLTEDGKNKIRAIIQEIQDSSTPRIVVQAFSGPSSMAKSESQQRAYVIKAFIEKEFPNYFERIAALGFGKMNRLPISLLQADFEKQKMIVIKSI